MARRYIRKILSGHLAKLPLLDVGEFGLCVDEGLYIGTPNGNKKIAYYDDIISSSAFALERPQFDSIIDRSGFTLRFTYDAKPPMEFYDNISILNPTQGGGDIYAIVKILDDENRYTTLYGGDVVYGSDVHIVIHGAISTAGVSGSATGKVVNIESISNIVGLTIELTTTVNGTHVIVDSSNGVLIE